MLYPAKFGHDPLYPKPTDFEVIHKDETSGKGVVCYRAFKRGEVIAKICGEITNEIRQHTLQIDTDKHLFDTYFSGYFLHSCAPNISLDMKKMTVTALEDIPADTHITFSMVQL